MPITAIHFKHEKYKIHILYICMDSYFIYYLILYNLKLKGNSYNSYFFGLKNSNIYKNTGWGKIAFVI